MNDKKGKNTKKSAAAKKAKGGQSNKKPAAAKTAGAGRSGKAKGSATKTQAATAKVFRVDINKGPIRQVTRKDAVQDALRKETFTEETINAMLDRGEVVPSPDFYYASTEKALQRWAIDAPPESAPLAAGDIAFSAERGHAGEVRDKDGKLRIFFVENGRSLSVAVTAKWGKATPEQEKAYRDSIAPAEVEVLPAKDEPMTKAEAKELAERESVISQKLTEAENLPMVIGENLNEILVKRLWRESVNAAGEVFKTFGEYASERFGITREYAHNLAQISGYHAIAVEALPAKLKDAGLSVNSTNALVRATNKMTKNLGLDDIDGFEELRPLIVNTAKILGDVAPKDERTGKATVTPRLVNAVTETLNNIVKTGTVEIEGKQMSIADAQEKGVLGAAAQGEILQVVAEGIKANRQTIVEEAKSAYQRSITPRSPNGNQTGPKPPYTGTVPSYGFSCDKHGATTVISIGSGTMQTKCRCRWRMDAETKKMVCFEVLGKRVVKPAE